MDSDDEEGPVVEGWSIFENSTDSSSSETTLGLDAPQSPIWEDRLESFLRRRRAFSVDHEAAACVEINQCVGCTRQFFTKSFLGDDAAVLAPSSGEEPASPRHRAGVAMMA